MALVALLRGVNVGGHRRFRPSSLAKDLQHLDVVSIGAAGTFVARARVGITALRDEIRSRVPFEAEVTICREREIVDLMAERPFTGVAERDHTVRFVTFLGRTPRNHPLLPLELPDRPPWLVKLMGLRGRLAYGLYRRHMRTIRYLGELDGIFGVSCTTRGWSTVERIGRALGVDPSA